MHDVFLALKGTITSLLFDALIFLNRFGRDSRGRFGGVSLLHACGGGGDSTPGFAAGEDRGAKHQGENQQFQYVFLHNFVVL